MQRRPKFTPPYKARRQARDASARMQREVVRAFSLLLEERDRRQRLFGLPMPLGDGASGQCR